jgi:SOS response regulatory protein OraA/RecX
MLAYLEGKGIEDGEAESVVQALVGERLIDDDRYSGVVAREQARRARGPRNILSKLKGKGVSVDRRQAAALFREASDLSELELAGAVLERRHPAAARDAEATSKAYAALLRRGFSCEVALQALRRAGAKVDELPTFEEDDLPSDP